MKKLSIITLSILFLTNSQAQFKSLLSANGEGSQLTPVFSTNRFAGQLSAAYSGSLVTNVQNPASYSSANLTNVEVGTYGSIGSYDYKDSTKSSSGVSFSHFTLLMPLTAGKSGMAMGIYRSSNMNYGFKSVGTDATFNKYSTTQLGEGNLYNIFIGAGFKIKNLKLGANFITQIGKNDYLDDIGFIDSSYLPTIRNRKSVSQFGILYNLGAQYDIEIDKDKQVTLGGYYNGTISKSGNSSDNSQTIFSLSNGGSSYVTLKDTNYSIDLPSSSKIGLGVNYLYKKSLMIGIEYNTEDFSQYKNKFDGMSLNRAWHTHLGFEYKPFMDRDVNTRKYFNRMTYRAGAIVGKSEQTFSNTLNDLKVMGGATFPIVGRNIGYLTLGLEYASRGFGNGKSSVVENVLSIHLILTFADKWFIRQKFD